MDHDLLQMPEDATIMLKKWLTEMKNVAIDTNKIWAERLGINQSAAITCVKPSGTVSQLVDSASGIHPRFSKYYIRESTWRPERPAFNLHGKIRIPCRTRLNELV